MTPGELLWDETRRWMVIARDDIRTAEVAAGAGLDHAAVYHCQQAAEKSLKAFLTSRQQPFRKTHNLAELVDACLAIDPELPDGVRQCTSMSEYAWVFRYPGGPREIDEGEAAEAIVRARAAFDSILARLPERAHPE